MNSSIRSVRSLTLIVFALTAAACGQLRKAPVEAESQSVRPDEASALRFELMIAQEDRALPAQAIQLADVLDEKLDEGAEAILRNTVQLPDPSSKQEFFLTWGETYKGRKITDANFVHRTIDSLNRPEGDAKRQSVSFDKKARRWFIPFKALFGGRETQVDAATRQLLSLDLYLDGAERVEINLEFRVNGALPKLGAERLEAGEALPSLGLYGNYGISWKKAFPLERERFRNPTGRKLAFWIRVKGGQPVTLRTRVQESHFVGRENAPPEGPFWTSHDSVARFTLTGFQVVGSSGSTLASGSVSGEWTRVTLEPFASATVSYLVSNQAARCSLPADRSQVFRWRVRNGSCSPRVGGCDGMDYEMHSRTVRLEHRFAGARLEGAFEREVVVADPAVRAEDLASEDRMISGLQSVVTPEPSISSRLETGDAAGEAPLFSCQGVF